MMGQPQQPKPETLMDVVRQAKGKIAVCVETLKGAKGVLSPDMTEKIPNPSGTVPRAESAMTDAYELRELAARAAGLAEELRAKLGI